MAETWVTNVWMLPMVGLRAWLGMLPRYEKNCNNPREHDGCVNVTLTFAGALVDDSMEGDDEEGSC